MNIKANEECKITKGVFGKYVYSFSVSLTLISAISGQHKMEETKKQHFYVIYKLQNHLTP
jgi:hypothetical protein